MIFVHVDMNTTGKIKQQAQKLERLPVIDAVPVDPDRRVWAVPKVTLWEKPCSR